MANSLDWPIQMEILADRGNIIIVNSSIETINIKDRMYGIYLPSYPSYFQLQELIKIYNNLKNIDIDVNVEGNLKEAFNILKYSSNNNFDAHNYLNNYMNHNLILQKNLK